MLLLRRSHRRPSGLVNVSLAGERRVEFGSGDFGSGEFGSGDDVATNGTNATAIPPRPGAESGVGFYDGPAWRYVEALIGIIFVYFAFTLIAQAIFGCVMRRSQWWNPPFLTGLVGMGDGSTLPSAFEKFLFRVGWYSAAETLLFSGGRTRRQPGPSGSPLAHPPGSAAPTDRARRRGERTRRQTRRRNGIAARRRGKVEQAAVAAIALPDDRGGGEAMEKLRETANLVAPRGSCRSAGATRSGGARRRAGGGRSRTRSRSTGSMFLHVGRLRLSTSARSSSRRSSPSTAHLRRRPRLLVGEAHRPADLPAQRVGVHEEDVRALHRLDARKGRHRSRR